MKEISKYWNKISLRIILPFILVASIIYSCQEPDPFPVTPKIFFNNLQYVESAENGVADSLILYFDFEDGDGDLGLPPNDIYYPIHDYYVITGDNALPISISDPLPTDQFLYVPPYFTFEQSTSLPDGDYFFLFNDDLEALPPYDCADYEIVYINDSRTDFYEAGGNEEVDIANYSIDTILVYRNTNRYNFYIDFFRKRGDSYEPLNLSRPDANGCIIPFNGRFPILELENIGGSLEGTIKYSMASLGFRVTIRNDQFKMKFHILDHHFRESNVVETADFTLDQLIR